MSNFWNSLKAPTLANQNLAKVDSHVGHFKKICWELGQKPPETETKADKSRCMSSGVGEKSNAFSGLDHEPAQQAFFHKHCDSLSGFYVGGQKKISLFVPGRIAA